MFMTLHLSGKGRYIKVQKSFLNGKSHKHCRGFHTSLPGDGSFDSPQSRNSKEKKFMVLPRSGFGGLRRKVQGSDLGQRSWHLLAENCSAMCCRMKNKMYRLSRQKQLEKPCWCNTHYRVNAKHQAEPVVPQIHPTTFLPMTHSEAVGIQAQS